MIKSFLLKNKAVHARMAPAVSVLEEVLLSESAESGLADERELDYKGAKGFVVGVLGAKGGVGATTTAINLSVALSRQVGSTILLDANMQQPDAAVMLGREPKYSLLDLLQRADELDASVLDACLIPVADGVGGCALLSPPLDGEALVKSHLTEVAACLENMRGFSESWLIDLPKHLDRHLVTLMDSCDRILLVLEPTLLSISSARRWLSVFLELGYAAQKIVCVVNRCGGKVKDVEEFIGAFPQFSKLDYIPNAFQLTQKCSIHGEPAVVRHPRQAYSKAIEKLATRLTGTV